VISVRHAAIRSGFAATAGMGVNQPT